MQTSSTARCRWFRRGPASTSPIARRSFLLSREAGPTTLTSLHGVRWPRLAATARSTTRLLPSAGWWKPTTCGQPPQTGRVQTPKPTVGSICPAPLHPKIRAARLGGIPRPWSGKMHKAGRVSGPPTGEVRRQASRTSGTSAPVHRQGDRPAATREVKLLPASFARPRNSGRVWATTHAARRPPSPVSATSGPVRRLRNPAATKTGRVRRPWSGKTPGGSRMPGLRQTGQTSGASPEMRRQQRGGFQTRIRSDSTREVTKPLALSRTTADSANSVRSLRRDLLHRTRDDLIITRRPNRGITAETGPGGTNSGLKHRLPSSVAAVAFITVDRGRKDIPSHAMNGSQAPTIRGIIPVRR